MEADERTPMAAVEFSQQLEQIEVLAEQIKAHLDSNEIDGAYEGTENLLETVKSLRENYVL